MHIPVLPFIAVVLLSIFLQSVRSESGYYLKAAKNVPRIGRSGGSKGSSSIDEMGKFFMKASKSVPRIGRRNDENLPVMDGNEDIERRNQYPLWSDIAARFEYDPELFVSPEYLARLEEELGDDPSVYEWDKVRVKRNAKAPKKTHPKLRYLM